jgi:hypothetical protein
MCSLRWRLQLRDSSRGPAVALGLGTTVVGAYDDATLAATLGSTADEQPLALLPVGRK